MTLDQFAEQLNTTEQRLMNLTPILTEIGNQMTAELRMKAAGTFPNSTGRLAGSISLAVQPTEFNVTMLDYGAYQNYGVRGTDNATTQKDVEEGLPGAGREYQFRSKTIGGDLQFGVRKSIAERGLDAKNWFSIARLTNDVKLRLQTAINNMFQ